MFDAGTLTASINGGGTCKFTPVILTPVTEPLSDSATDRKPDRVGRVFDFGHKDRSGAALERVICLSFRRVADLSARGRQRGLACSSRSRARSRVGSSLPFRKVGCAARPMHSAGRRQLGMAACQRDRRRQAVASLSLSAALTTRNLALYTTLQLLNRLPQGNPPAPISSRGARRNVLLDSSHDVRKEGIPGDTHQSGRADEQHAHLSSRGQRAEVNTEIFGGIRVRAI